MIMSFVESKAHALFKCPDFADLSESMVQMIMCRELQCPEIRKFEAMLAWAKFKVSRMKIPPHKDLQFEFECIMERLTRDLNLCRISPSELLSIVLPSKALKNERIMETLMMQVNLGTYRMQELDEYRKKLRSQDSDEDTIDFHHQAGWNLPQIILDLPSTTAASLYRTTHHVQTERPTDIQTDFELNMLTDYRTTFTPYSTNCQTFY